MWSLTNNNNYCFYSSISALNLFYSCIYYSSPCYIIYDPGLSLLSLPSLKFWPRSKFTHLSLKLEWNMCKNEKLGRGSNFITLLITIRFYLIFFTFQLEVLKLKSPKSNACKYFENTAFYEHSITFDPWVIVAIRIHTDFQLETEKE